MYKLAVFPNILAFQEGSLLLCLSKPSSLVCYGFSLHHTSSSSTHICISLELFMLCFVFNTLSCKKARLPGIKQSKTPLPLKPVPPWLENLWPSHRPWDRSEEEAGPSLKLGTLLFLMHQLILSPFGHTLYRGDGATDGARSSAPARSPEATCFISTPPPVTSTLAYTSKFVTQIKGSAHC